MKTQLSALLLASLLFVLYGCNTEREVGEGDRAILKAGQQVSAEMVGWVAVPNTAPAVSTNKESNVTYAVVTTNNVIPAKLNGWVAMNPALFTKMTKIAIEVKEAPAVERLVLKPEGKAIPKDKNGWIAIPLTQPAIESNSKNKALEMAVLSANNLVPKELNGWVAVDKETLATLSEKYMSTGTGSELPKVRTPAPKDAPKVPALKEIDPVEPVAPVAPKVNTPKEK
jgi:hypothetical protein